jgi:hypothetical protein
MLESISTALAHGIDHVDHIEFLTVLQGGIGYDGISDITCNILKSSFIKYTQDICRRHGIPMGRVSVRHAEWSAEYYKWSERRMELPINPFVTKRPLPILLTPEAFIRDIPVATANKFWTYAWANNAKDLRDTFNFDIARHTPRQYKARLARANIEIVKRFFKSLEEERHEAYPVEEDPKGLTNPQESRSSIYARFPGTFIPSGPEEFANWVQSLIHAYSHSIEQQDAWKLLWYKAHGREEAVAQRLFRLMVVPFCRFHNVDVTPESNAGRGPVDFKFSQGWKARAIVELKLVRNTDFWNGIIKQVPAYAKAEEVKSAFVVGIAYTDEEMQESSIAVVKKAAKLASERNSITIDPVIIDARVKPSASKLRMTKPERDELHAETDPEGKGDDPRQDSC